MHTLVGWVGFSARHQVTVKYMHLMMRVGSSNVEINRRWDVYRSMVS